MTRAAAKIQRLNARYKLTREQWLRRAIGHFRKRFAGAGYPLPTHIHVSVGLPSRKRAIGQHWNGAVSRDGFPHVFISPVLNDGVEALETLVHELVHAALPIGTGHKARFVKAGNALGLTDGKPTSLGAGPELRSELRRLNAKLPYPHAGLDVSSLPKAQGTRLVKVSCEECGYTCRVTRTWLDGPGAPICPTDGVSMVEASS